MAFLRLLNLIFTTLFVSLILSPSTALSLPSSIKSTSSPQDHNPPSDTTCAPVSRDVFSAEDITAKTKPEAGVCPIGDFHLFKRATNDFSCSEVKPCSNGACCAKTGYCGYGPDSCGDGTSPNNKCWSNCDATAECGRYAKTPGQKCPLNVCCSQFGFCGMTPEFCAKTNNVNTTCQSNCDQPGSGASGGNVQNRVIGYYEAWNYNKNCIGMQIKDIPVGSITHLHFAFGYIAPQTFQIVPMDKLSTELFAQLLALKQQNPALKVLISLGGWTFNDNFTITQPVFSDIVSNSGNRARFISNLMDFMQNYGFDGVDFDWEYPGAGDRGGRDTDGVNYTQFLKELRAKIGKGIVSFTAPTSFWYLQHFDLKATTEHVDWINVMSYDLHGIWDKTDPIGNHVLAHTNLTEIKTALDLYWRNGIPANKINLGLGFYGRSFQLTNPSCSEPGCLFKGPAAPGVCTDNPGTLSYREIMQIIDFYNLQPYYDKTDAVKYITWGSDQWVSFDDQDTFQQKIKFANDLGLGGLLIWSLDQDTAQLDALQGVIYPKKLGSIGSQAKTANNWDHNGGDCRVTDCGVTGCNVGEARITDQQCDSKHKSSLCCPLSSAPDPKTCSWQGEGLPCNGQCLPGQVALESSKYGGGGLPCTDGLKFYCCDAVNTMPQCRWTGCGKTCNSQTENALTWQYDECRTGTRKWFCCDKAQDWRNCAWHGKPGSCFDDHCDTGHQVSLTTSWDGEGETCGIHFERTRSFCCDPPKGVSPFLPVPLEDLFSHPPTGSDVDTDFNLQVDPTYGGSAPIAFSDDPEDGEFGFVVLASPETLQVTLNKRDGSHWEVFDCFDAISEEEQTVRMVCTDHSETSNCDKINLGHGAPGTIIEMPKGCGPGKYAVAKSLELSKNQELPGHLVKRGITASTIFDLTFDYDFRRVPRDLGEVQVRVDYSNEPGYWDNIVNKAATAKRKRSLEDYGGNHERWLEDAWREDMHGGSISKRELHERWFGSGVVDWLRNLVGGISTSPHVSNRYSDDFTIILADASIPGCPMGPDGTLVSGNLKVEANTHVEIDTNFGFTLITTLSFPIDLSNSYLYFRNRGEVTAKFTADIATTTTFDSGDVRLLSADQFGAAFSVPGILTIGPNFQLFGSVQAGVTLGASFEANVNLAKWDIRQTYPDANHDWDPDSNGTPDRDGTQDLLSPEFKYGISANGFITAHVKPTVTFGIEFNKKFININPCTINLVADGYITLNADASTGSSFCYGVDAGADLYATIDAPPAFGWTLPQSPYHIAGVPPIQIVPHTCPFTNSKREVEASLRGQLSRPEIDGTQTLASPYLNHTQVSRRSMQLHKHKKRAHVVGPIIHPKLTCPKGNDGGGNTPLPCPLCSDPDLPLGSIAKRSEVCIFEPSNPEESICGPNLKARDGLLDLIQDNVTASYSGHGHTNYLAKRTSKLLKWDTSLSSEDVDFGPYPSCSVAARSGSVTKWYGFDDEKDPTPPSICPMEITKFDKNSVITGDYQTDHILECITVLQFFDFLRGNQQAFSQKVPMPAGYSIATDSWVSGVLMGYAMPGTVAQPVEGSVSLLQAITRDVGGNGGQSRMALLLKTVNNYKGKLFRHNTVDRIDPSGLRNTKRLQRAVAGVFQYMKHGTIWPKFQDTCLLIENSLREFDNNYPWNDPAHQIGRPFRAPNEPRAGLRDLWCYFIDRHLLTVENAGGNWANSARQEFISNPMSHGPEGQNWLNTALSGGGTITAAEMQFPHSGPVPVTGAVVQTSRFGAWNLGPAGPF